MNYINPPTEPPQYVTHKTFYSRVLNHEIGYNIYLPPEYKDSGEKYPVVYHIHGWVTNLLRFGQWKRSIKADGLLMFLST